MVLPLPIPRSFAICCNGAILVLATNTVTLALVTPPPSTADVVSRVLRSTVYCSAWSISVLAGVTYCHAISSPNVIVRNEQVIMKSLTCHHLC